MQNKPTRTWAQKTWFVIKCILVVVGIAVVYGLFLALDEVLFRIDNDPVHIGRRVIPISLMVAASLAITVYVVYKFITYPRR